MLGVPHKTPMDFECQAQLCDLTRARERTAGALLDRCSRYRTVLGWQNSNSPAARNDPLFSSHTLNVSNRDGALMRTKFGEQLDRARHQCEHVVELHVAAQMHDSHLQVGQQPPRREHVDAAQFRFDFGQRSGITWEYALMLAQIPGVNADCMVVRYVADRRPPRSPSEPRSLELRGLS